MPRNLINKKIRNGILAYVRLHKTLPTRTAINYYSHLYNVPKNVVSGCISGLVRSGMVAIYSNKPYSYMY